ncbi:MAG: SDR family NAD(P)-dependent oxidoreductase [Dermatophilaceae bacterium]
MTSRQPSAWTTPRLSPRPATPPRPRRALVTGAASGLGLALVRALHSRGDEVMATDMSPERPAALPPDVRYASLDVRSDADWARVRAEVESRWGGLDLLFNNAGIAGTGRIDVATMAEWQEIVDVNLLGVVRGCRTFVPLFKEQESGHVVNTASLAGLVHGPGMSTYNAVKAAVVAVSETLDAELHPWGVRVSALCPSFFRSNLTRSFRGADTELDASGRDLVLEAGRSADQVAAAALRGVDRGRAVVLTDLDGTYAWYAKRLLRPVYLRVLRGAGRDLRDGRRSMPLPGRARRR